MNELHWEAGSIEFSQLYLIAELCCDVCDVLCKLWMIPKGFLHDFTPKEHDKNHYALD